MAATALTLLANGWVLGTLASAIHRDGIDYRFWAYIVPHGVIELSVIVLAGNHDSDRRLQAVQPLLELGATSYTSAASISGGTSSTGGPAPAPSAPGK